MSELTDLWDAVRGAARTLHYVQQGTLVATNPEGHVVDALTPARAAFIVALVNAFADGRLVERTYTDEDVELVRGYIARHFHSNGENVLARAALDRILGVKR